MTQTDKAALTDRLSNIGMVTPTLAKGQPDMVRDIDAITGEILEAKRVGGEAIITIGQRLIEAKSLLSHGEWLPWLNEKVEFSERAARRFMQLARECTNRPALADLGATKALQLLALPESEREEFLSETHRVNGEEKAVIDMTSRELEKAIRERDEARKTAEQAQADARSKGVLTILFLRWSNQPNRPYVTIEMDGNQIVQVHGYLNDRGKKSPRVVHKEFFDTWLAWLKAGSKRDKDGKPILPGKRRAGAA